MLRTFSAVLLMFILSGCVLQSKAPLFGDSEAKLVFGDGPQVARVFSRKDGAWVDENETVTLTPEGQHYVAMAKDGAVTLRFIPLQGPRFVVQANEADKPPVYLLADVGRRSADFRVLSCDDLKSNGAISQWVSYQGDDCFVEDHAPRDQLFKAILAMPGEASSRLTIAG